MQLREKTATEIIQLAVHKLLRSGGGKEVVVFLPAQYVPPAQCKPYKVCKVESEYGEVRLLVRPSASKAGWVIHVRFSTPIIFNPVLPKEAAEKLQQKAAEKPQQK